MYAFIAGNHEYCVTLQTARAHLEEQGCMPRFAKGGLSPCNMRHFGA